MYGHERSRKNDVANDYELYVGKDEEYGENERGVFEVDCGLVSSWERSMTVGAMSGEAITTD